MDALRLSARGRHGGDAPFHLGRAQIDPTSREATYGGRSERIQDKPLCVLLLLHRRSGQVVTREDIVDECWDGRIVGDDVINRAISILRKLARRAGGFRIDTIPRAGYRLVKDEDNRRAQSRAWRILASALIAVAVLTAAAGLLMRLRGPVIPAAPTVSVLPFVASGGPDAAGMARRAERALVEMLNEAGFTMAPPGQGDLIISGEVAPVAGTTRVQLLAGLTASGTPAMSRTLESPSSHADDLPIQVATSAAELVSTITELWTLDGQMADPRICFESFRDDRGHGGG
jgi:DNA-binding winged helix-turn-helix (wHTH) protein